MIMGEARSLEQLISDAEYAASESHLAKAEMLYRLAITQLDVSAGPTILATLLNKLQHVVEAQGKYAEGKLLRAKLAEVLTSKSDAGTGK